MTNKATTEKDENKTTSPITTTAAKASFLQGLRPSDPNINTYLGHPWTKNYYDIVPEYNIDKPTMRDLDYYAKNFGLDTSVGKLKSKFDAVTRQEYAQKNAEYRTSEDQYYQNAAQQGAQYQDAITQASAEALKAGASRGMQFANQFAAQNTIAEQNSTGALDLATQRNNLKAQEAEEYAQNELNAEDTIRNLKTNILGQAVADRANEVQRYAADAQLAATDATLRINNYQYNMSKEYERMFKDKEITSQEYIELLKALATMRGQDVNYGSEVRGQDLDFISTLRGQDKNLEATKYSVDNAKTGGYGGYGGYSGSGRTYTSTTVDTSLSDLESMTYPQAVEYMQKSLWTAQPDVVIAWAQNAPYQFSDAIKGTELENMTTYEIYEYLKKHQSDQTQAQHTDEEWRAIIEASNKNTTPPNYSDNYSEWLKTQKDIYPVGP